MQSFIPDAIPVSTETASGGGASSGGNTEGGIEDIAFLVAIVIFAVSLAAAAGMYILQSYKQNKLETMQRSLERVRNEFDKDTINNLEVLGKQLAAADKVLQAHSAPSEFFRALENLTLKSVQYENLDYRIQSDGSIKINLDGKALSLNAVALQSKILGSKNAVTKSPVIKNPVFSDLGYSKDGTVKFKVAADVNPDSVNFTAVVATRAKLPGAGSAVDSLRSSGSGQNLQPIPSDGSAGSESQNTQSGGSTGSGEASSSNGDQADEFGL